jgi:ATP-binding cassette subfamily B protein
MQFYALLILIIAAAFLEIVSIGSILPFLSVLTMPSSIFESAAKPYIQWFGYTSSQQILFPVTVMFCLATLLAGSVRLAVLWVSTKLSFALGADLSISIYRRTLYQPYSVHVSRNSSEVINGISGKANGIIYSAIMPSLTLISSGVILISILGLLIYVDPTISIIAFFVFGSLYGLIAKLTYARKIRNGKLIARESTQVIKSIQEGLGGIRDALIDGSQEVYCQVYRKADLQLRQAQGNNQFVSQCPRYGMEALGMIIIALIAYFLSQQSNGVTGAIPMLGVLALGAQRLLPIMQQTYASWSSIVGGQASLEDAVDLLDQPLPSHEWEDPVIPLSFTEQIDLKQIGFRYGDNLPWVLHELDLKIIKGSRIGFIGVTGSGKSTLLDVIMGLLTPTKGILEVDNQIISPQNQRSWHAHIAHVPQSIFLSDGTIEENIAFGVPEVDIDHSRVIQSARQAQISETIESWPEKYKTSVGERGIRLSGGQRQRIGIARALYKQADVIILDEATSALDNETEKAVMDSIDNLNPNLTILIIAHRITTLKNCSKIVKLKHGRIEKICSYSDLLHSSH